VVARSAKAPRTRPLMKLYLDTSALVKLVSTEPESSALRRYLESHAGDTPSRPR
jgi:hypothetical protein